MKLKLNVYRLVLSSIFAVTPIIAQIIAQASPMKVDKDGKLVVANNGFSSKSVSCDGAEVNVLYGGELTPVSGYSIEFFSRHDKQPVFMTLTKSFSEFVDEAHDLKSLELKCLPAEKKIGIFVPSRSEDIKALHIMIMKDGRVLNGYNLSGHDQTAITNIE